tara:strand:+ start:198 stop:389 length:192 start_codon:yes stop_codon:yes gene_type:complete
MATYEGALQPFLMNYILWAMGTGHFTACMMIGAWGSIIGGDNGVLMEQCLNTLIIGVLPTYYE